MNIAANHVLRKIQITFFHVGNDVFFYQIFYRGFYLQQFRYQFEAHSRCGLFRSLFSIEITVLRNNLNS